MIRVTVWNEYNGTQNFPHYPKGLHEYIKDFLNEREGITAASQIQFCEGEGLTEEILSATDVLVFWAHGFHELLSEAAANRVVSHVQRGMGAVFLHSAHMCKPFRRLMGTSCTLKWREAEERERLWIVDPTHPVAKGLPEQIVIPHEEMYGEKFDIPTPDALIAIGWFQGGEVMRSVCAYQRGLGRIVYIQPGHETYPVYLQPDIQQLIENAVRWTAPVAKAERLECPWIKEPLEKLK